MQAAEEEFEAGGRKFRAGAFVIPNADRAALEPTMKELGISGFAVGAAPPVAMHELDVPRIGYVHSWSNTQNEGWVRAALDTYGVPVHLLRRHQAARGQPAAEVRRHRLPARRREGAVAGQRHPEDRLDAAAVQEDGRDAEPRASRIRPTTSAAAWAGKGLMELVKFVREGGTLITEGATSTIFPEYNVTNGVTVENAGRPVRPRLDHARRVRRSAQPDRVRLRRAGAGVLQPGAGAERRRRRRRLWRRRPRR